MDKYLHTFENDTARTEYENGSEYVEPYVSLVESDNSVHYNKVSPTLSSFVFDNNASGRKIYVPSASVEAYKSATNWSAYANDILPIP